MKKTACSDAVPDSMADQKSAPKADPATKKILVVDDDEHVRLMVVATLEAEGFVVKSARDGRQIVKLAEDFKPDLIFSDLMMPGGGGYELLRALQAVEDARHIPILLMSGVEWDDSTKSMMLQESNVVGFIEKPLRPAVFLLKIHQLLRTKSREETMMEEQKKHWGGIERNRMDDLFH